MGESLLSQDKQMEAEKLFKEAVEMQQHSLSLRHPQRARSNRIACQWSCTTVDCLLCIGLLGLGRSLSGQDRWEEAEPHLKEAVDILTDCVPHHPRTEKGTGTPSMNV